MGFWGILIAVGLVFRPLIPIDETRYLSVAWEMFHTGNYLVPHINGLPYSHKPPLLFWLINLGWNVVGVHEWVARSVSPLFGLFSIFLTIRLARMLWPDRNALATKVPYILLGSVIWTVYGSLAMFDTLVVFFTLGVLMTVWKQRRSPTLQGWLLVGLLLGCGMLAKGPVIFVYTLPVMLLVPYWIEGRSFSWWSWYGGIALSIIVGAAIILSWALPAAFAGGEEYKQAILFSQTAGRAVKSFAHQRPWYWYLMLAPLLFFPWTFYLSIYRRKTAASIDSGTRFCTSLLVPSFLLLSLISGKQIHYILPLLPFFALLVARLLEDFRSELRDGWLLGILLLILGVGLPILPFLELKSSDAAILRELPVSVGVGPLLGLVCIYLGYKKKKLLEGTGLAMVVMAIALQITLNKPLTQLYFPDKVFEALGKAEREGHPIAIYPGNLRDQIQFSARLRRPVTVLRSREEVRAWAATRPETVFLIYFEKDAKNQFVTGSEYTKQRYKEGMLYVVGKSSLQQ